MANTIPINELDDFMRMLNKVMVQTAKECALPAVKFIEGKYKERLFGEAKATSGAEIGKYSTEDMLIGGYPKTFKTKKAANKIFGSKKKRRKLNWVSGAKVGGNTLAVLEGGYKEFRDLHGLRTDKVDLEFTGDLRRSIQVGKLGKSVIMGFTIDKSRLIAEGQEDRFNKKIFTVSDDEINQALNICLKEFENRLAAL